MAMTAAERQRRYRERNGRNAGKRRINLVVAVSVATRLDELARQYGVYKQEMLERAILEYGSLLRSDTPDEPLSCEQEAERLLLLVDGDVTKALDRLTREAKQAWPDFTWSRAAAKQALPGYRRLYQIKRFLRKMQQHDKRSPKTPVQKSAPPEVATDQMTFSF